ncbi:hypothetical protein CWI85_16650, partial [Streptomyces albidoflavus]
MLTAGPAFAAGSDVTEPVEGLPETPRGAVVSAYKGGGRSVREAASAALLGDDAHVTRFLDAELPAARAEDNRFAILASLARAGKAVEQSVTTAMLAGNEAVAVYLRGGYEA